jgi:hypothetical protein
VQLDPAESVGPVEHQIALRVGRPVLALEAQIVHQLSRSRRTLVPDATFLKTVASPSIRPTTFTGLAGRTSSPRLAGVGPKKMQNAWPGGQ